MKNYKLDIKEMTEQFNAVDKMAINTLDRYDDSALVNLTQEHMSEMVQKHAFKLGYKWRDNGCQDVRYKGENLALDKTGIGRQATSLPEDYEKIGLEFFSIKPVKFVTVKMPEEDYINLKPKDNKSFSISYDKWELVE